MLSKGFGILLRISWARKLFGTFDTLPQRRADSQASHLQNHLFICNQSFHLVKCEYFPLFVINICSLVL